MKAFHQFSSTVWEIWLFKISFLQCNTNYFVVVFVILCCLYNQLMLIFENFLWNLSINQVCFSTVKQQNILSFSKIFGPCLFFASFVRLILMVICIWNKTCTVTFMDNQWSAKTAWATVKNSIFCYFYMFT